METTDVSGRELLFCGVEGGAFPIYSRYGDPSGAVMDEAAVGAQVVEPFYSRYGWLSLTGSVGIDQTVLRVPSGAVMDEDVLPERVLATFPNLEQMDWLLKLERLRRDRIAGVSLDTAAQTLLKVLDEETSVRWDDLAAKTGFDWADVCRAVAMLASADLCEAGPSRIRLSEFADKVLADRRGSANRR